MIKNDILWWKTPAESPDLNPIEMVWAHMKAWVQERRPSNIEDHVTTCPACPKKDGTVIISIDANFGLVTRRKAGTSRMELRMEYE